jgi:hypothetical protein
MHVYRITEDTAADADTLAELTNNHTTNRYIDTSDKAQGDPVTP